MLDLFSVSADTPAANAPAKNRPVGQKAILDNLAELQPEEECTSYSNLRSLRCAER